MSRFLFTSLAIAAAFAASMTGAAPAVADDQNDPLTVFEQRIMPIFRSSNPSSCVQCHLSSVDLKNYILPSHEKTFVSLRDQGLIDLDRPEKSKILTLIHMGEKDLDKGAKLIHAKTRKAEYESFAAWIKACCGDSKLRNLPSLSEAERAGPAVPDPVIRHTRKSRVVDSFVRNVWSQRMRCFPCHTPHEIDPSNPKHRNPAKKSKEFEHLYGEQMRIFRKTPEATLKYLIEASRNPPKDAYPLINLEDPRNSLLVLKPTSKLPKRGKDKKFEKPSSTPPVSHMGGLKMHPNDTAYKSFIAWLQDYANIAGDRYASVEDLPADNWHPSQFVLKVSNTPEPWRAGIPVQLFVYAQSDDETAGQAQTWIGPIAFTQGTVTPRGRVMGPLVFLGPKRASLKPGRFLIKAYVDAKGRLKEDPTVFLNDDDFHGQAVIDVEQWREGFRAGRWIAGDLFKKG